MIRRKGRLTYKRRRCTWTEPTGAQCRARAQRDSDRCLLHAEPPPDQ